MNNKISFPPTFLKMIRSLKVKRVLGGVRFCLTRNRSNGPEFTKNHPDVRRGTYESLQDHHINYFRNLLGESRLIMDLSDLEQYNVDWTGCLRGNSSLVLRPKSTEEVSQILAFCNQNNLAVCPQGGNTCLVGGSVPVFDEIILSMGLMNKIENIDDTLGILVCQSGCVLENLDNELSKRNLMMPLDLGAKGSCQIGGNISTNAGGLRLLRYGNLQGTVLGVEAVKANGEVLDCLSSLKKDNTGYHLKHLFIGSEGTLGVVTRVAIQCATKPNSVNLAFLGLQNFDKVINTYKQARVDLGEILSAMEVIDSATMDFIKEKLNVVSPIGEYPFYLMIETSGSNEEHDADKLSKFLDLTLNTHLTLNGTIATEPSKVKELWKIRERIPNSFVKGEIVFVYDLTFPVTKYYTIVDDVRQFLGTRGKVFGFGHLGDGNLHLQIVVPEFSHEMQKMIETFVFKRVKELGGSISAEHGIGFLKAKYLKDIKDPAGLELMKNVKTMMDPRGILNPYKTIMF